MAIKELLNVGAPNPPSGKYVNVGSPLQKPMAAVKLGDQLRGTLIEWPVLTAAVGYLWYTSMIRGNENRRFTLSDILFSAIVAFGLKRIGVGRRWKGRTASW